MASARSSSALRTDARRNADRIRAAAVRVFGEQGLSAPLEEVAAAAHVSRATIFNRFGGRVGLIEAVIDEVVAAELTSVIGSARSVDGIRERIRWYVGALRDLQYRVPAVNDVLLQEFPDSDQLMRLCHGAGDFHEGLVAEAHAAGVLHPEFTSRDLQSMTVDNALVLKYGAKPARADYDRRTAFVLRGICTPIGPTA